MLRNIIRNFNELYQPFLGINILVNKQMTYAITLQCGHWTASIFSIWKQQMHPQSLVLASRHDLYYWSFDFPILYPSVSEYHWISLVYTSAMSNASKKAVTIITTLMTTRKSLGSLCMLLYIIHWCLAENNIPSENYKVPQKVWLL